MKAKSKFTTTLFVVVLMILSACAKKYDYADIDHYVQDNNSPEVIADISAMEEFEHFECYRDGYDIVAEYTFNSDYDLEDVTNEDLEGSRSSTIQPIVNDYRNNDYVERAVETMKKNNGNFIYIYKDNYGHQLSMTVPAEAISAMAK